MSNEKTRWVLDFYSSKEKLVELAEHVKVWADQEGLEFRYTDLADNEFGMPVLAILPKETASDET